MLNKLSSFGEPTIDDQRPPQAASALFCIASSLRNTHLHHMMRLDPYDHALAPWLPPRVLLPQVFLCHFVDMLISAFGGLVNDRTAHNRIAPWVVFVHNTDGYLRVLADVLEFEVSCDRIDDDVPPIGFYVNPNRRDLRRPISHNRRNLCDLRFLQ